MKKLNLIELIAFMLLSISITTSIALAIPFNPTPNPPYQNANWGVDIGDIFWWNITTYEGDIFLSSFEVIYRINDTVVVSFMSNLYYAIMCRRMIYNDTLDLFEPNPVFPDLRQISLVNFTNNIMYHSAHGSAPITFFIPRDGQQILTIWAAQSSYFSYKGYFNSSYLPSISTTSTSIRYYNDTTVENIDLIYYNDGSLKSGIIDTDTPSKDIEIYIERVDSGSEEELTQNIPFGNFYIIFIILGISTLIIYLKIKKIKN